ncbi:MAG: cytochrome c oxidase assembly protein [Planctomycetes bacterium]|nr:cytochrome c oxidase assembly protein [Planctomycetota bacterium]
MTDTILPNPTPAPAEASPRGVSPAAIVALFLIPVAMLCFALFAFKPLYLMWCKVTGTQFRPNNPDVAAAATVHTGRYVKVFFETTVLDDMPVRFWADKTSAEVEVGADATNLYHFHNVSDHPVHFRPVHQVSPINASTEFGMKVCFCFNDQVMAPGETKEFPVVFSFAPKLDERVKTVTLCYSLFEKTDAESAEALQQRIKEKTGVDSAVVSPQAPGAAAAPAPSTGSATAPAPATAP